MIISSCADHSLRIWDSETTRCMALFCGHSGLVVSIFQKVDPSLTALFAVSGRLQLGIELGGDSAPLLGAILSDQLNELFIFFLCPVALVDGRLLVLIELVQALGVISSWNEASDLNPVELTEFVGADVLFSTVLADSPLKENGLLICPIFLGVERFNV